MTGNRVILDTNIVIELLNGNKDIADKINQLSGFSISSIVVGEMYIGFNRVANKTKHLKMFEDFLQLCSVLDVNAETAVYYGEIMAALHKKGKPIPTNDIWIAANAKQHGFTLITLDKHFKEVQGISVKHW